MAKKVTINSDGVFVDGVEVPGVSGAEIKNINPGTAGSMEVTLLLRVNEIDVQYSLLSRRPKEAR